ncbi:hypothetical protein Golob_011107, partial [Gossypium lobatum]|nr:hypothetical protein [Gossypium lobatum]
RGFAFVAFRDKKTTRDTTEGITGQNIDGGNIPWETAVYFEEETVGTTAVEEAEDLVVSKEAMTAEAVMVMVTQETALRRKSNRKVLSLGFKWAWTSMSWGLDLAVFRFSGSST